MKACCQSWLDNEAYPLKPKEGTFTEVQACPKCGKRYRITFEEIATMGDEGESDYVVVGADPV